MSEPSRELSDCIDELAASLPEAWPTLPERFRNAVKRLTYQILDGETEPTEPQPKAVHDLIDEVLDLIERDNPALQKHLSEAIDEAVETVENSHDRTVVAGSGNQSPKQEIVDWLNSL